MACARRIIASAAVVAAAIVVLADVHDGVVDAPASVVLVVAFVVLARNTMRLASEPSRRDAGPPQE